MSEPGRQPNEKHADFATQRSEQLYTILTAAADAAVNFLFLVSAGGAVATLSFLGASPEVRAMLLPKIALSCFVAGLILVGFLRAFRVHDYQRAFDSWQKDCGSFLAGQLTWEQLNNREEARSETSVWEYVLGYASFGCILVGAAVGAYAFFATSI